MVIWFDKILEFQADGVGRVFLVSLITSSKPHLSFCSVPYVSGKNCLQSSSFVAFHRYQAQIVISLFSFFVAFQWNQVQLVIVLFLFVAFHRHMCIFSYVTGTNGLHCSCFCSFVLGTYGLQYTGSSFCSFSYVSGINGLYHYV